MINGLKDNRRHPIPRWRDYNTTLMLGELDSSRKTATDTLSRIDSEADRNINNWKLNKTLSNAVELVQTAIVSNKLEIATEAAEFIVQQKRKVSNSLFEKALFLIGNSENKNDTCINSKFDIEQIYERIKILKNAVKIYPRNSIYWMDLALLYTNLGQINKAEECVIIARNIAPNNRFILRGISRFYFHKNDFDKALYYLRKSELIKEDPWVLAAEIAFTSAINKTSNFIRRGNQIIENTNFSSHALSEVSSAIGTIEYESGKIKTAKKLIRKSLESPSDNSLAQALFLSKDINDIIEDFHDIDKSPCSYEAEALYYYQNGNWDEALKNCFYWFEDIPFSSRSAVLGSFIAAELLQDYNKSKSMVEMGLVANPDDHTLMNNLIFAELNLNNLDKAEELIKKVHIEELKDQDKICMYATIGMYAFRKNQIDEGKDYYKKAIGLCNSTDQFYKAAAYIHLAYEEKRLGIESWKDDYITAKNLIGRIDDNKVVNAVFNNKFYEIER